MCYKYELNAAKMKKWQTTMTPLHDIEIPFTKI